MRSRSDAEERWEVWEASSPPPLDVKGSRRSDMGIITMILVSNEYGSKVYCES
jgi:hypothetical protein